ACWPEEPGRRRETGRHGRAAPACFAAGYGLQAMMDRVRLAAARHSRTSRYSHGPNEPPASVTATYGHGLTPRARASAIGHRQASPPRTTVSAKICMAPGPLRPAA